MLRRLLAMLSMQVQRKLLSILLITMIIIWDDLEEERWLTSISGIITQSVFILSTKENIEDIILWKPLGTLINLSLLMLKRSIKSSILIESKRKLSIRENSKSLRLIQNNLASQISLFRLLPSQLRQQIRINTRIGDQTKLFMRKVHNFLTTRFHFEGTPIIIQHLFLTLQRS